MIIPLLVTLAILCALLLLQGMLSRGRIYQYPFLAGAVFAGFALPQFVGLAHYPFLPDGALEATLIMANLSAAMCWLGSAAVHRPLRAFNWDYDERRLLIVAAALSLLGGYFYYAISRLPVEMTGISQWTGLPVAYLFLARILTYGFAIGVLLFARTGSRAALLVAVYGAVFALDRIVNAGRRQDLIEFLTIIMMAFWFQRNRCVPRPVMLAGLVLGALFVNSIGDYRAAAENADGPSWDTVSRIDFVGNFSRLSEQGGAEVRNAVFNIAAVRRSMKFDLGLGHWNALIFSYVPAQIVGTALKQSLYLPLPDPAYEEYLYTPPMGSTWTGLSDAFQSFWYFGALKFFLIAFVMQKLWLAAQGGNLTAQLLYMLMPVYALEAITHTTQYFLGPWVHMAIFLLPALLLARRRCSGRALSDREATANERRGSSGRLGGRIAVERAKVPAWTSGERP
jgi:hypothetical protein